MDKLQNLLNNVSVSENIKNQIRQLNKECRELEREGINSDDYYDEIGCCIWHEYKLEDEEATEYLYKKYHQPTKEEKYPGVVFTPQPKIHTICEDDDIVF